MGDFSFVWISASDSNSTLFSGERRKGLSKRGRARVRVTMKANGTINIANVELKFIKLEFTITQNLSFINSSSMWHFKLQNSTSLSARIPCH